MFKIFMATASALAIGFAANAQEAGPLAGDKDYLADAYSDAEAGESFSYASQWGNGRAYDGTDTSRLIRRQAPVVQAVRQTAPAPVRTPVQTVTRQTYTAKTSPPYRPTQPVAAPPRPVVNTLRTITRPAPVLRGATGTPRSAPTSSPLASPPRANPGECFARMKVPAQYDMVPRQIPVAAAYERARITPARFSRETQQVMVKPAHTRYVVSQPKFAVQHEQLMVKPAHDRLEVVPARFAYVSETVTVSQPRLAWKRGVGLSGISRVDPKTGETWCLVEQPGETTTVRKRVVAQPEQVRRVPVAAQTLSIPRQVLVQKGGIRQIDVPAEYRDFAVQRMQAPASSKAYNVPAETGTVMTKVLKSPERFEWVGVLCDTNSGPATIRSLQTALKTRGLYAGHIDGVFGPQTRKGLVRFQRSAGIAHLGYLTSDTVRALGIR